MNGLREQLRLGPEASDELRSHHDRLRGVHEFLQAVLDVAGGKEGLNAAVQALARVAPWAGMAVEAVAESLPPLKFLLKLFEGLTKIDDPNELGYLACTLAFQRAVQQAVPEVMGLAPPGRAITRREVLQGRSEQYDFADFSWEGAANHPFVTDATQALAIFGEGLGLDGHWNLRLQREVVARFLPNLAMLLSHGGTRERFAPFRDRLELGTGETVLRRALLDHADTQRWIFEERPVLGTEPFSLAEVYIEPRCTLLEWQEIARARARQDPFDQARGQLPLFMTVTDILADPEYEGPVIVQGPAGSGKSSFTLRLCTSFLQSGLLPLRIELKHLDARTDVRFMDKLARAFECNDLGRFPERRRFLPQSGEYGTELLRLFDEEVIYQRRAMCPYVLILDGWDELPLSGAHNYVERLRLLLRDLDETLLRRREPKTPVRVILVGRPSHFLAQSGTLAPNTPIVTLQPWSENELQRFIGRVARAQARAAMTNGTPAWRLPAYLTAGRGGGSLFRSNAAALDILGSPLLAHLCLRLLGEHAAASDACNPDAVVASGELLGDRTTLYRHLVDLVIVKAGKAPAEDYEPSRGAMIAGIDLRSLLQRTAEAMTVLGVENVAHDEMLLRLGLEEAELEQRLLALEGKELLSRLMISFFFKGGHEGLGCEFSHKSFREYLFAEAIVEALKDYASKLRNRNLPERAAADYWEDFDPNDPRHELSRNLPERAAADYWKDFDPNDPRHELSRRLGELFGPQWLTVEVSAHVEGLIAWEVARLRDGTATRRPLALPTPPCTRADWESIRDGLADLWDWWGDGVHLRPQPRRRAASREYDWLPPHAVEVAREARFRASTEITPPPIHLVSVDGHLGDALLSLNVFVHAALLWRKSQNDGGYENEESSRPPVRHHQVKSHDGVRFAPTKLDPDNFFLHTTRIAAAGNRPQGPFPRLARLGKADLSNADLSGANLSGANLSGANLTSANLSGADLTSADLTSANLTSANLARAELVDANLSGANLASAELADANLASANLTRAKGLDANLTNANLASANLTSAELIDADLRTANLTAANFLKADLSGAFVAGAELTSANLSNANLSGADLTGADLTTANLSEANLTRTDLTDANLTGAILTDANVAGANLTAANLSGAFVSGANLSEANLSDVHGTPYSVP
jgi:uncharacterized protein YjbI with pentapeptide repeats